MYPINPSRLRGLLSLRAAGAVLVCAGLVARAPDASASWFAPRVMTGHVYDTQRRPITDALVGVRSHIDSPRLRTESDVGGASCSPWYAGVFVRSGADGEFHVEVPAAWGTYADSALDVMALALDFDPAVSKIDPGAGMVDVTLTPAPWHPYAITAQTPDNRPATAAVTRAVAGVGDSIVFQMAADPAGQMRFRAPTTTPIAVVVSTPGYRPVEIWPFQYGDTAKAAITVVLRPVMTGVVRDEHGHPAAGVGVWEATGSGVSQTVEAWRSHRVCSGAETDVNGRYTLAPTTYADPEGKYLGVQALAGPDENVVFADSGFTQLTYAQIDPAPPGATAITTDVTLHPTRTVHIPILEPRPRAATGYSTQRLVVSIETVPVLRTSEHDTTSSRPVRVARADDSDSAYTEGDSTGRHEVAVRIPPGRYRVVEERWPDIDAREAWFDVPPGASAIRIPEQRPPLLPIYAMLGHLAPALDATDLDGKPAHLADYRGKVIVLDFWGYWCGSCVDGIKTHLIPFAVDYAGKPVTVLALHDASIRSRAEYDRVFDRLKRTEFGGRDFPFPVLLDRPTRDQESVALGERTEGIGQTVSAYNVTGFPSTFVIDARGLLAERVDVNSDPTQLRRAVDRLLGEAAGARQQ